MGADLIDEELLDWDLSSKNNKRRRVSSSRLEPKKAAETLTPDRRRRRMSRGSQLEPTETAAKSKAESDEFFELIKDTQGWLNEGFGEEVISNQRSRIIPQVNRDEDLDSHDIEGLGANDRATESMMPWLGDFDQDIEDRDIDFPVGDVGENLDFTKEEATESSKERTNSSHTMTQYVHMDTQVALQLERTQISTSPSPLLLCDNITSSALARDDVDPLPSFPERDNARSPDVDVRATTSTNADEAYTAVYQAMNKMLFEAFETHKKNRVLSDNIAMADHQFNNQFVQLMRIRSDALKSFKPKVAN